MSDGQTPSAGAVSTPSAAPAVSTPTPAPSAAPAGNAPAPSGDSSKGAQVPTAGTRSSTPDPKAPPPSTEKPKAPAPSRFDVNAHGDSIVEITVDGRKHEMPLKEALRIGNLDKAAQKRMQEAAEIQRRAQATVDAFQKEPAKALAQLGPEAIKGALRALIHADDPAAQGAVQEVFQQILTEAQWTPEQRLEADRKKLESERKAWETEQQERQRAALAQEYQPVFDQHFRAALEAQKVDVTPDTLDTMAELALGALDQGQPLTQELLTRAAQRAAEIHRERRSRYLKGVTIDDLGDGIWDQVRGLEPKSLVERLGEEKWAALREFAVKQAQSVKPKAPPGANGSATTQPEKRPLTLEEVRERRAAERAKRTA